MENNSWREETISKLKEFLSDKEGVVSFSLFGSLSKPDVVKDKWSDIDALLVVKDSAKNQFYPSPYWLEDLLCEIFAYQTSQNSQMFNMKVIFSDFRKIDLVITTDDVIIKGFPVLTKQKIVFSKSEQITKILNEAPLISKDDSRGDPFEKLVQDFWYVAFVAITKLMRNDLLISLDLSLQLYQGCLHMAMILRDKETGTNIHRTGGVRNEVVQNMNIQLTKMDKKHILLLIEQCAKQFDALSKEYSNQYKLHFPIFEKVILSAEKELLEKS